MKVYLGKAVWRTVEEAHSDAMADFAVLCDRRGVELVRRPARGDALVSRARSRIASQFLRSDADVLLTVDGDIVGHPIHLLQLCEHAMERSIVGAAYPTRSQAPNIAVMLPQGEPVRFAPKEPLTEVPFVSGGCMAVHRRVFERLKQDLPLCHGTGDQSFWPFYMPFCAEQDGQLEYLSEDWALCERARQAGFGVWLDPSVRFAHLGETIFSLEDLLRPEKPSPRPMTVTREGGRVWAEDLQAVAA